MTFGEKIKQARSAKNMSQHDLAVSAGLSDRAIQNYESGTRVPKDKTICMKLAAALDTTVEKLLDDSSEFIMNASEQYGSRGRRQAEEIIRSFRVAAAGGDMSDEDLDFVKDAMMQTYQDAKRYNQRFVNKKYKKPENS